MAFELPALPYDTRSLEPHLSREAVAGRYGRDHRTHVERLNALVAGTEHEGRSLEAILHAASGETFAQAAEAWNLTFFWHCLSPRGGGEPGGELAAAIAAGFGSIEEFRRAFEARALTGAGWTWLVRDTHGGLVIRELDTPLVHGVIPLLGVEVRERAYGHDYPGAPEAYLAALWRVVNWDFMAQNLADRVGEAHR